MTLFLISVVYAGMACPSTCDWNSGPFDGSKLVNVLSGLIPRYATIVSVGANTGQLPRAWCEDNSILYRPTFVQFEPVAQNVEKLNELAKRCPGIVVEEAAVSSATGTIQMRGGGQGAWVSERDGDTVWDTRAVTLDEYFKHTPIWLLEVDVQGHEAAVFEGAKNLLKNNAISIMLFEWPAYSNPMVPKKIIQM